eukprot:SAG11_NODE_1663_length_4496_cov_2.612236_5_plen_183_part_00
MPKAGNTRKAGGKRSGKKAKNQWRTGDGNVIAKQVRAALTALLHRPPAPPPPPRPVAPRPAAAVAGRGETGGRCQAAAAARRRGGQAAGGQAVLHRQGAERLVGRHLEEDREAHRAAPQPGHPRSKRQHCGDRDAAAGAPAEGPGGAQAQEANSLLQGDQEGAPPQRSSVPCVPARQMYRRG